MKNNIFLMLLIFFLFAASSAFANDFTTKEDIEKISEETQFCIDNNYMSDYTMASCADEGTKKYNIEIKRTVKAAKNYLSKGQYKRLLKTQDKWEKYMEENVKFLFDNLGGGYPSYLGELTVHGTIKGITKNRLQGLINFLQNYNAAIE